MHPDKTLKLITNDLRVIAVILILLGALSGLAMTSDRLQEQIVGGLAFLILLAPGAWFAFASFSIRRGSLPVVRWSLWIAGGQVVLVLLSMAALPWFLPSGRGRGMPVCTPSGLFLFFFPAEAALIWQLFRARGIIRANEMARGFDVHAIPQALPVEVVDQSESDRSK
jgi:hypothetical protein